ncbi:radical SAM protein [Weeksellaceae bacterium A-14]
MKISQFNNIVFYDNKNFIYNSFSNKFIGVDNTISELFKTLKTSDDIAELTKIHPTFYNSLIKNGFLVNKELDEIEEVKKISKKIDTDESHYSLIVNPTMNCNFKCWYCYESHVKGSKMNADTVSKTCALVSNIISTKKELKTFHISWFGGEPLMYYKEVIAPIMAYTQKICNENNIFFDAQFTTNGFLFTDEIIEELKAYNINGFQITLDGNKKSHDKVRYVNSKRGSYETIINNIIKLCQNDYNVGIRVNYSNENLDDFEEVYKDFERIPTEKRNLASVAFHKVWQVSETTETSIRVKNLIKKVKILGFAAHEGAVPDNVRNSCYADKINNATINYNGDVYKCTARDFSSASKEGVLDQDGKINWNPTYYERMDIKFKNKPCLECPIMPLCNGGCSQHALENKGKDYCVYDFDETQKKDIIVKKLIRLVG